MKLKKIKSFPIDSLVKLSAHTKNSTKDGNTGFHTDRRKFLKLAGMAGIGASVAGLSNLLFPKQAYGGCFQDYYGQVWCDRYTAWYYQHYQQELQNTYGALLPADFNRFNLANYHLPVYQPTSGLLELVNDTYEPSSGTLSLTIVDSRSLDRLEDERTVTYTIPPRTAQMVEFDDGPSGQCSGGKRLTAWTRRGHRSSSLTVYA